MPHLNRVDPFGDLHAVADRGLLTGNRGCLVDEGGAIVRHHQGSLWISCLTSYKGWRSPLTAPRRWTPVFFLDEAVALAAGHRPCGLCRRPAYLSYKEAVTRSADSTGPLSADDLNRRLATERLRRGRGVTRGSDRILWDGDMARLPTGSVIVGDRDRQPMLVLDDHLRPFGFGGWGESIPRPRTGVATILTPPTSVAALVYGYEPLLHASASQSVRHSSVARERGTRQPPTSSEHR